MLMVGWIAWIVLVWAASPAHFWFDSGELSAAGHELGVMHPPGAPGFALLLRAAAAIPVGSLGFRGAAVSCGLAAASIVLLFDLLRRRGAPIWLAAGASAWVLGGWTFVREARVVEIYALGTLLSMLVLWGFDPALPAGARRSVVATPARRSIGVFAAVWGAWAFGDLRLALVPAIVVAWLVAMVRGRPWARFAPLVVVFASAMALAVPLAAAREPASNWGDARTVGAWFDHVFARSIRTAFADDIWPSSWPMWRLNAAAFARQMGEDLGPLGSVALLVAVAVLVRVAWRDRPQRVALVGVLWIALVEVVYAIGINPMGIADRQTGMVLGPIAALVVGEAMRSVFATRPRVGWIVGPCVWMALVVPAAWRSASDAARTRSWGPHAWTRDALAQLPVGSLLLVQSDDLAAGTLAAKMLEGARPDVTVLVGQHLHRPIHGVAHDPRRLALQTAAAGALGERARVDAVIAAHAGPVALESPGTGVFGNVAFWDAHGDWPLRIRDPAGRVPLPREAPAAVEAWLSRLPTDEDRKRLAVAIANDARARVRFDHAPAVAQDLLELVVRKVRPDHASAWVTLAALRHAQGDTARAIAMTRHALVLEPGRAAAMTNLALYLGLDPATFPEALDWAQAAIALRPNDPGGWERLADLRARAGDQEGAAAARDEARLRRTASSDHAR